MIQISLSSVVTVEHNLLDGSWVGDKDKIEQKTKNERLWKTTQPTRIKKKTNKKRKK